MYQFVYDKLIEVAGEKKKYPLGIESDFFLST